MMSITLVACSVTTEESAEDVPASTTVEEKETQEETVEIKKEDENDATEQEEVKDEEKSNSENKDEALDDGTVEVGEPESIQVVVNKQRKLPSGYVPENLTVPDVPFYFTEDHPKKQMREEAANALEELFAAAEEDGLDLVAASGYRSYDRQKNIYERNVAKYGKEETDKFSAQPGTSEHQTGLAMDVTSAQVAFQLEQSFGETQEGEWLAENAHEHGFIIRYLEGAQGITGYTYEPWHLRYVDKDISSTIHNQGATLEEFFGLHPSNE
jgi:zinc D-Ala-D-Ala carboxypeptidase